MSFIQELKRRNVFRVAIFYLVSSWVILQVGALLFDIMELSADWKKVLLVILLIGFPIALAVSWVFEVTPDGVKRESQINSTDVQRDKSGQRMNMATIIVVLIGIVLLGVDRYSKSPVQVTADSDGVSSTDTVTALIPIVAVLPFSASGSDDGGFLAGGLHDDLLTRLARLNAFKVISRTSMMEYAQTTKNMREIGQELGAGYILQGGVQARGQRVRINAQLVDAENDKHLWAETYDRELSAADLFDIQAELARAIASELSLTLSGADNAQIDIVPTQNIAAYNAYLRALDLRDKGGHNTATSLQAIDSLKQSVAADPTFADAWAELSIEYSRLFQSTLQDQKYAEAALESRARAKTLNPDLSQGFVADAVYQYRVLNEYQKALDVLSIVESKEPLTAPVLNLKAFLVRRLGDEQQFYQIMQQAYQLDPRSVVTARFLLDTAVSMNKCHEARLLAEAALALAPDSQHVLMSTVVYEMSCTGDLNRASQLIANTSNEYFEPFQFFIKVRLLEILVDFNGMLALTEETLNNNIPFVINLVKAQALIGLGQDAQATELIDSLSQSLVNENDDISNTPPHRIAMWKAQLEALKQNPSNVNYWVEQHKKLSRSYYNDDKYQEQANRWIYAELYAAVGLKEEAINELTTFFALPSSMPFLFIDIHPVFDILDDHPGYEALRTRYGSAD